VKNIKEKKISSNFAKLASPENKKKVRPSIGRERQMGEYYYLKIDKLLPYSKQVRKFYDQDELEQLATTIKQYGIRLPLTVIKADELGFYEIISGERRFRAAKLSGLEKLPCIILDNDINAEEIAVIENIQRSDLHPLEFAEALNSLLGENSQRGKLTRLSEKLGVPLAQMSEVMTYGSLPDQIKDHLIQNNIRTRKILRQLTKCKGLQEMEKVLGIAGSPTLKKRSRTLFRGIILDGKVRLDVNMRALTEVQKSELKLQLQKLINSLEQS